MPSSSAISLWCVLAFLVQIQSLVLPPRVASHRRGTALASDLVGVDPSAVSDLVQGLDAAIGNPTAATDEIVQASTKAVDMAISDPTILAAGGVATLSIGLAAFLASNKEDDAGNETAVSPEVQAKLVQAVAAAREEIEVAEPDAESTGPDASSQPAAEVASESKEPEPEPEEPESDVSMEAKEPEPAEPEPQEQPESEASMESAKSEEDDEAEEAAEEEVAVDLEEVIDLSERLAEPRQRGLLLQRFLNKKTELLQKANQKLGRQKADLSNTEIRLQETQAQLSAVTRANQGLFTQYKNEKDMRQQVTEELSQTKQEMETLQQTAQADMDAMVEANQQLEDKFEFEQMEKKRRISELHETEWELDTTRKQLYKTSAELASVKDELAFTQKQVQDTSNSLKELKDDTKSMRKLTGNMWKLSKNRVKGIFRRNKQQE